MKINKTNKVHEKTKINLEPDPILDDVEVLI